MTHSEFQKVISHKNVVKNHLHYNINMGLSFVNNKKIFEIEDNGPCRVMHQNLNNFTHFILFLGKTPL